MAAPQNMTLLVTTELLAVQGAEEQVITERGPLVTVEVIPQ